MNIDLISGDSSFLRECTASLQDSDLGRYYFPSKEKAEKAIREFLGTEYFLVAVDERKRFAGFLCYLPAGAFHAFPYLHLLVTSHKIRGTGIGTKMMDIFEEKIFKYTDKIFLVAADFNPRGQEFYKKRDYREIGLIPSLYRNGIDERLMMKTKIY